MRRAFYHCAECGRVLTYPHERKTKLCSACNDKAKRAAAKALAADARAMAEQMRRENIASSR